MSKTEGVVSVLEEKSEFHVVVLRFPVEELSGIGPTLSQREDVPEGPLDVQLVVDQNPDEIIKKCDLTFRSI